MSVHSRSKQNNAKASGVYLKLVKFDRQLDLLSEGALATGTINVKHLIALFVLVLFLSAANAQSITSAQLTGKWHTDSVEINMAVRPEQQQQLEELRTQFSGVTFVFNEDGSFYVDYPPCKTASIFEELFPVGQKTEWVFYEDNASVTIGTSADNYSIMSLTITKEGSDIYFEVDESYIKVRVTKL